MNHSLGLTPAQLEKVEAVVAPQGGLRAALDVSDTGTGKTLCAVEVMKRLDPATTLIVGPAKPQIVAAWKATFTRQGVTLPFKRIDSKHLDYFDDLRTSVPGVYYVGREYLGLSDYNARRVKRTLYRGRGPSQTSWCMTRCNRRRTVSRVGRRPCGAYGMPASN